MVSTSKEMGEKKNLNVTLALETEYYVNEATNVAVMLMSSSATSYLINVIHPHPSS